MKNCRTLRRVRYCVFVPLVVLAFAIGLYPKPIFQIMEQPVQQIVQTVRPDLVAVLFAVLGLYYCLRIANAMLMRPPESTEPVAMSPGLGTCDHGAGNTADWNIPRGFLKAAAWSL
jgi:hypothetical protein